MAPFTLAPYSAGGFLGSLEQKLPLHGDGQSAAPRISNVVPILDIERAHSMRTLPAAFALSDLQIPSCRYPGL